MNKYEDLYNIFLKSSLSGNLKKESDKIRNGSDNELKQYADMLIDPKDNPVIISKNNCSCDPDEKSPCEVACLFDAIKRDENGHIVITSACSGCGACLDVCQNQSLIASKDTVAVTELLRKKEEPVFAMIAPAFSGQFSPDVTSGKLRSAFKKAGFYGMLEVALFADILTLKESLEFDRLINDEKDFLLTSCCCPIWVAMIRKNYSSLVSHVPPSVSPMVACGRTIKLIHPGAKTVFIGPCIAKKAEVREADIIDAVDYVLTFEEISGLFGLLKIDPAELPEDASDHSSTGGRIYARAGGVSEAVGSTLKRLRPERKIPLKAETADGVPACRELLKRILEGDIKTNFIEGMGCRGGCVGGPKSLIDKNKAREYVDIYGGEASSKTPADNEYVLKTLEKLGFDTVESLLERDNIYTRKF